MREREHLTRNHKILTRLRVISYRDTRREDFIQAKLKSFAVFMLIFLMVQVVTTALPQVFSGKVFAAGATYYVDATGGDDTDNGTTTGTAWKTIAKVNSTAFMPGDTILFKRGEVWRNNTVTLRPAAGSADGDITYGAYGTGDKPILTMAKERSNSLLWTDEGSNIWSTGEDQGTTGSELLPNPGIETNLDTWTGYFNSAGSAVGTLNRTTTAGEFDSGTAGMKLSVSNNGTASSDIRLYTDPINISGGKTYKLSFRAKASNAFGPVDIKLVKDSSNYFNYANTIGPEIIEIIGTDWTTYTAYFTSSHTATDARIDMYLGGIIPDAANFYIDTLSLKELTAGEAFLSTDVGNIIMNNKTIFGLKEWASGSLDAQGDYWYDIDNHKVKMYSTENPGTYYDDVTLVMRDNVVLDEGKSYITFDGLELSMAGEGIDLENGSNFVTVKNCDVSYIGGGDYYMDKVQHVRYGNAIQVGNSGHDISVYNNRIWEIYDGALAPNGNSTTAISNLYFYNNLIWDVEYGLELWERPDTATVDNLYIENNTIVDSGQSWGSDQRPGAMGITANGRAFKVAFDNAEYTNVTFRNNILYKSTGSDLFFAETDNNSLFSNLTMTNNHYDSVGSGANHIFTAILNAPSYDPDTDEYYYVNQFNNWKTDTGKDANSIMTTEGFTNVSNHDFTPVYNSPDIDAGAAGFGRNADFLGNPIYGVPDIGAYEYQPPYLQDGVNIDASGARIYADGKFRDLGTVSTKISLKVSPTGGSFPSFAATAPRPQWLDITDITWLKNGSYSKQWTENSTSVGLTNTVHTVGDLAPNAYYTVSVNGARLTNAKANSQGVLTFTYAGDYSSARTFTVNEATYAITAPDTNYTASGATVSFTDTLPINVTGIDMAISSSTSTSRVLPTGKTLANLFNISATDQAGSAITTGITAHLALSYPATNDVDEAKYTVMYWDTASGGSWSQQGISNIVVNTAANTISFDTTHFSEYAVFSSSTSGVVLASVSGAATTLPVTGAAALPILINFFISVCIYVSMKKSRLLLKKVWL